MEITKVTKPCIKRGANTFGNIVCIYIYIYIYIRAVVLESGLESFFYRLGLVLDSLVFGLGLGHRTSQIF